MRLHSSRARRFKSIRNTLTALVVAMSVGGCAIVAVTAVAVVGIDVARDRRGASIYWDDNKTERRLAGAIDDQVKNENVSVTVYNGVTLLTGEVPDQRDIDSIIDLAKADEGVRQVINRLELAGSTNMTSRANDSWLTAKVKTAIAASDADSTRIKVVTERANVYLMGLVTPKEAEDAVNATRTVTGVVRVIKVFEYIETT
ncbi:MAG: BON domain-containing protein [Gammaproteobacteria bacterium]|nr:BON domain-containing protein [Gammaproteobacteria bacterium]